MTNTKLVTIVPPVAKAAKNLIIRNRTNQGDIAAATPVVACNITAHSNGFFLPNLKYLIL